MTSDRLQLTRIKELLAQQGCAVSYTSLRRLVRGRIWLRGGQTTVRMADTRPGNRDPSDLPDWQSVKVHSDHRISFGYSVYIRAT